MLRRFPVVPRSLQRKSTATSLGCESHQLELARVDNDHWTVNESHRARQDAINNLLETIKKVRVKSPVNQSAMNTIMKTIISSHVLVEIYQEGKDEPVKTYYVGGANQLHTGTNMMMKGSTRPFVMHIEGFHGFLTPRYFVNGLEWRSREVFEYNPNEIQALSIAYSEQPERNFKVTRDESLTPTAYRGAELKEAKFDTLLLNGYLQNYKMVHYESYEETKTDAFIDSVKASTPLFTIELKTQEEHRIVHGYRKPLKDGYDLEGNPVKHDQDRIYIWVDSNELYIGQYAIFDKLTKGVYFFR